VVELKSFTKQLDHDGRRFVARYFTMAEFGQVPASPEDQYAYLAGCLAAKRAFVKAWSATSRGGPPPLAEVDLREIEVLDDEFGRPGLRLHGLVAEAVEDLVLATGVRVEAQVSVACDGPIASAVVILSS
jgi:holo-[acyl-carrier protein] synthase